MRKENLYGMIRGWFVGDFSPTLCKTDEVEVGIKRYQAGDYEGVHYHKIATEITVIVSGAVEMNGVRYEENDILVIEPYDATDFLALTDAVTTVVKIPGAPDDKYLGRPAAIVDTAIVDTAIVDTAIVDTAIVDTAIVDTAIVDAEITQKNKEVAYA